MNNRKKISGGLYLVVDPAWPDVLTKIEPALKGGVDILQVWNNWNDPTTKVAFIHDICHIAHAHDVPVIINNEWPLLGNTPADGVHFDELPEAWNNLKATLARPVLTGVTCGNDEARIAKAIASQVDYLSFCAMFPSSSAGACEIVTPEVVKQTRLKTSLPLFVSGGITPANISTLSGLGIDGVAVISGILKTADPQTAATLYKKQLQFSKSEL